MRGRSAVVLAFLLIAVLALSGCGKPSIEGEWFYTKSGEVIKIDKEWMTDPSGHQLRYTLAGDTALQVTLNNETADVRYEVDGDTLVLTGSGGIAGTYVRVGSSAYKTAKAAWDKKKAEEKSALNTKAAADKKEQDKSVCATNREHLLRRVQSYVEGTGGETCRRVHGRYEWRRDIEHSGARR